MYILCSKMHQNDSGQNSSLGKTYHFIEHLFLREHFQSFQIPVLPAKYPFPAAVVFVCLLNLLLQIVFQVLIACKFSNLTMYKTNSLHKMFSSIVLFFSPRNQHFAFAQGMKSPQNRGQSCDLQVSEDLRKSEETRKLGKDI